MITYTIVANIDEIQVKIALETLISLHKAEFKGQCPVCYNLIDPGEIVCCDCLDKAVSYHRVASCGCVP